MMIFSSLPPVIEIITVGAVAVAFVTVVLLVFYCAPTWRKKEDGKLGGIECEPEHQWTKASHEQGTSTQRIAYYGTLSLSAQNSPTRHLRSISATNPPTHFLSPSHTRSPRRNSSPIGQQGQQGQQCVVGCSRALSPHVVDMTSVPVQPPYWDPDTNQYFHSYANHSPQPSPLRTHRSPAKHTHKPLATSATNSPAKRSPPNPSPLMTTSLPPPNKHTDYSNLFLPPAPIKHPLFTPFAPTLLPHAPKEPDDILHVSSDTQANFTVTLHKQIPTICSTPPEQEQPLPLKDVEDEQEIISKEDSPSPPVIIATQTKAEILALESMGDSGEEKHAREVNVN